ncbi:MAG: hypothetical protein AAF633_23595 [Chloroflexota bacterium]
MLRKTLFILITIFLLLLNSRLYFPAPPPIGSNQVPADSEATLRYLRGEIEDGAAARMQALFPEGAFFLNVTYGLTQVNNGLLYPIGSNERIDALEEARFAYAQLEKEASIRPFYSAESLSPPFGIFYTGWRNYLLAGILLLQAETELDPTEREQFTAQSQEIAAAVEQNPTPFLQAYPGAAWPVDTFPAMVSLKAYGVLIDDRYEPLVDQWLRDLGPYLDPTTGLTPHRVDPATGAMRQGARATSQSLILRFLYELDPALAGDHYARFREQYGLYTVGIPGVREYPIRVNGRGDIDSGPLIAGASLSATTVMIGTARIYGDRNWGDSIWQAGEMLGMPLSWQSEKWYGFGVLPVGDGFAAWSKSSHPWLQPEPVEASYEPLIPSQWRLRLHLVSLLLLMVPYLLGKIGPFFKNGPI